MDIQKIGKMSLKNGGGFVARIQFSYLDDDGVKKLTGINGGYHPWFHQDG